MFVTFEGPEGAGKTTLIRRLAAALTGEVVVTREPGAGNIGLRIREILLHGEDLTAKAEVFLFLADRAQHVASIVRPALERGAWVLCDRFADSTVVYQGYARGLDVAELKRWNAYATDNLVPDLTFLLDIDACSGLERIADKDRLDREPIEFHERVRNGFLTEAKVDRSRWIILDATRQPEQLFEQAHAALMERRPTLGS